VKNSAASLIGSDLFLDNAAHGRLKGWSFSSGDNFLLQPW